MTAYQPRKRDWNLNPQHLSKNDTDKRIGQATAREKAPAANGTLAPHRPASRTFRKRECHGKIRPHQTYASANVAGHFGDPYDVRSRRFGSP
jgi:hypothetical protein